MKYMDDAWALFDEIALRTGSTYDKFGVAIGGNKTRCIAMCTLTFTMPLIKPTGYVELDATRQRMIDVSTPAFIVFTMSISVDDDIYAGNPRINAIVKQITAKAKEYYYGRLEQYFGKRDHST